MADDDTPGNDASMTEERSVEDGSVGDGSVGDGSVGDGSVGDGSVGDGSVGDSSVEDERPASIETATRSAESTPRATTERRWEVFVRENAEDPMTHVGTIAAPDPDVAHEEASTLFAWYARDLWVCPADETYRYSSETLGSEYEDRAASEHGSGEIPDGERGNAAEDGSASKTESSPESRSEPRVYEETEGTPNVKSGETRSRISEATDRGETPTPQDGGTVVSDGETSTPQDGGTVVSDGETSASQPTPGGDRV